MDILFKGQALISKEWIESDSILQGRCPKGGIRIFLKHRETFPKWIECDYKTVEQIKTNGH